MCNCKRMPRLPDFSKWTMQRLVAEARRLGVPSLASIINNRQELINILSDAWS